MKRCVNVARPQMHCNGKCQLMEKIKEHEKKGQEQPPEMKFAAKIDALSFKSSFLLSFDFSIPSAKAKVFALNSGNPVDQPSAIFHPPPACC